MTVVFEESGLKFGPFNESSIFRIEQSSSYMSIQQNTKIAEFLWLSDSLKLWVVEAKSSIPKPTNTEDYANFFEDIRDKLINAISLTVSGALKRGHVNLSDIPAGILNLNWSTIDIKLALVIPDVPQGMLPPMTDKLRNVMKHYIKSWGISESSINVLNREQAVKYSLSSPN